MKQTFASLIIASFSFLISCDNKLQSEKEVYIISKRGEIQDFIRQISQEDYYGDYNLILGDSNKVYFFKYHTTWNCLPSDNPPSFINLNPSDIVELPANDIDEFIELNYKYRSNYRSIIYNLASPYDSIKSPAFQKIMDAFAKIKQKKFLVRRTTFEEDQVLYHKTNRLYYDPSKIKWDTSKVHFWREDDIKDILNGDSKK